MYTRVYDVDMRTNIVIDDELLREAQKLTGIKTKKEVIHKALAQLIAQKKHKPLLKLRGKIEFVRGYDHKATRG